MVEWLEQILGAEFVGSPHFGVLLGTASVSLMYFVLSAATWAYHRVRGNHLPVREEAKKILRLLEDPENCFLSGPNGVLNVRPAGAEEYPYFWFLVEFGSIHFSSRWCTSQSLTEKFNRRERQLLKRKMQEVYATLEDLAFRQKVASVCDRSV